MQTETVKFVDVTEIFGQKVSSEQLLRTCNRYYWAESFVSGKRVLEVACGSGPGLGYLQKRAAQLEAGDISPEVLEYARATYDNKISLKVFDATCLPYDCNSFDVILLFEALYYLGSADTFMAEARRVLRPGGWLLIATANKDLFDFNPSPFSTTYHGVPELAALCRAHGFDPHMSGFLDVSQVTLRQKLLRPVKKLAVALNIMPKTMAGKAALKALAFGQLVDMPASIVSTPHAFTPPTPVALDATDRRHKVIYCAAQRI